MSHYLAVFIFAVILFVSVLFLLHAEVLKSVKSPA